MAKVLIFVQNNGITYMAQLVRKIETINEEYKEIADNIRKAERRLDTLATHITQCETRAQHRAVYNAYAKEKDPKKREAYHAKHGAEIEAYKEARNYLNAVMGDRTDPPPIKEWRKEHATLTAVKYAACERYYALQDEIRNVEQLRKGAENIMREDVQERQLKRVHDVDLS